MTAFDCQEGACGTSGLQARRHCLIGWKWGLGRFGGCGCRAGSTVPWPRTVDVAMGPHGGSHDERHRPLCAIIRFAHESCTTRVVPAAPPAVPGQRPHGGPLVRTKSGFQCAVRGWRAPGAAPCPRLRAITVRRIYIHRYICVRRPPSGRGGCSAIGAARRCVPPDGGCASPPVWGTRLGGIRVRRRRLSSAGAGGGRHDGTGHHGAGCRGLVNRLRHGSPAGRYGGGRDLTPSNAHSGRRSLSSKGRERPCSGRRGHVQGGAGEQPDQGSGGSDGTPLHCTGGADRASPQGQVSPPCWP